MDASETDILSASSSTCGNINFKIETLKEARHRQNIETKEKKKSKEAEEEIKSY